MALSLYNIKKWYRMLTGKSVLHVQQDLGKIFEAGELRGYFNNMTQKVTMEPALLENDDLPLLRTEKGEDVYFPVAIFQYGLGAWDLFLQTGDSQYEKKFMQCADWALEKQENSGAWNNFFFHYPDHPYGAMCQGEGVSLLLRAWRHTKKEAYLLEWSIDETKFYHTDSDTNIIKEYDFDAKRGEISFTGRAVEVPGVDGFTIDQNNFLYVACWGRGHIAIVDTADMQIKSYIEVPARIPASCNFVGEEMDKLAVVSASFRSDLEKDKNAGYTFIYDMKTRGRAPYLFG